MSLATGHGTVAGSQASGLAGRTRGPLADGRQRPWLALRLAHAVSPTADSTSSSTRSALMAMAAADPAPAEVMTWARGSAALPATQTPVTLVLPVRSTTGKL